MDNQSSRQGWVEGNCPVRLRLSSAVATAVHDLYAAKIERDRAVSAKQDTTPSDAALAEARKAERLAVAALNEHRKEHHC